MNRETTARKIIRIAESLIADGATASGRWNRLDSDDEVIFYMMGPSKDFEWRVVFDLSRGKWEFGTLNHRPGPGESRGFKVSNVGNFRDPSDMEKIVKKIERTYNPGTEEARERMSCRAISRRRRAFELRFLEDIWKRALKSFKGKLGYDLPRDVDNPAWKEFTKKAQSVSSKADQYIREGKMAEDDVRADLERQALLAMMEWSRALIKNLQDKERTSL